MVSANASKSVADPARPRNGPPLWPISFAAIGVALILGATMLHDATLLERLVLLNRYLARFSFLVFIPIYAASPLNRLLPGDSTRFLVRNRRGLGLGYALIMGAHVCAIVAYQLTAGSEPIEFITFLLGGLGFVLIAAMALTSTDRSIRRLGARNWRRLHGWTMHWLLVIYAFTYLGRIADGKMQFALGLATVLGLSGLRIGIRMRPPSRPTPP